MSLAPKIRKISEKCLTNEAVVGKLSGQRSQLLSQSDKLLLNSRQTKLLKILKRLSKRRTRDILRYVSESSKGRIAAKRSVLCEALTAKV
jgi:hypothetical protein